jgi:hypothetical protein
MTYPNDAERTALYRLFDCEGRLLYIGIARNPEQRFKAHASTAPWWHLVARRDVEWYPTRSEARAEETKAIKADGPLYNRAGSETPMNVALDFPDLAEISVGQLRNRLSDVLNAAMVRGQITYVTNSGHRRAAFVPVTVAEEIEAERAS